jgi:hypothetical protein
MFYCSYTILLAVLSDITSRESTSNGDSVYCAENFHMSVRYCTKDKRGFTAGILC